MKRAGVLIIIAGCCLIGFLAIWGSLPFSAVSGAGMAPEIDSGELIIIEGLAAEDIEVGDVIVVNVPSSARQTYHYPPVIAHRVIQIVTEGGAPAFQTKADNGDTDPFLVRQTDIRGAVSGSIPYLGYPLLLFRGGGGTVTFIIALVLLALLMYAREIGGGLKRVFGVDLMPVVEAGRQTNMELSRRFGAVEGALDDFSGAVSTYAEHLASHTNAIRGLSEASQSLKGSAVEQNRILGHLNRALVRERTNHEVSVVERVVREFRKKTAEALQARDDLEKTLPEERTEPGENVTVIIPPQSPPGCVVNPRALRYRYHF